MHENHAGYRSGCATGGKGDCSQGAEHGGGCDLAIGEAWVGGVEWGGRGEGAQWGADVAEAGRGGDAGACAGDYG